MLPCKTRRMGRDVHLHSHPSRVEHWRHVAEIAAFIAAAVWAIYVFFYQERIKPETVPPHFQATVSVEDHPLRDGRLFVKVHMNLKNDHESTASLAGLYLNSYGQRYGSKAVPFSVRRGSGVIESGDAMVPEPDHLVSAYVNEYHQFGSQKTFNIPPGATYDESVSFVVERARYDAVRVSWGLCWSHPTTLAYDPGLRHLADGSYAFEKLGKIAAAHLPGFNCYGNGLSGNTFAL